MKWSTQGYLMSPGQKWAWNSGSATSLEFSELSFPQAKPLLHSPSPSVELSIVMSWSLADPCPSYSTEGLRANKRVTFHSVWLVDQFEEHFLGQRSNPNAWVMPWDHIDRNPGNSDQTAAHCNGLCPGDLLPVRKYIFSASPSLQTSPATSLAQTKGFEMVQIMYRGENCFPSM